MDIFDVLEQAERQPAAFVVAEAPQPPAEMDVRPEAEPATPQGVEPAETVVAEAPQPPAELAEPVAGPAVQPVLVGTGEPGATPKKGWWRR